VSDNTTAETAAQKGIQSLRGGDMAAFATALHTRVLEICGPHGDGDLLGDDSSVGEAWWRGAMAALVNDKLRWFLPAEAILLDLWEMLSQRQEEESTHVNRAMISQYMTELQHTRGERGSAFRWALHTQADDVLGDHSQGGGFGRQWLRGAFGISDSELGILNGIAAGCRAEAMSDGWATPSGFPEEVVRRLATEQAAGSGLFAKTISDVEFHLSSPYLRVLLERTDSGGKQAKGDAAEDAISYLCGLLPGCVPRRNVLDSKLTYEFDLIVQNLSVREHLVARSFGGTFLVECKNWCETVGSQEVGYFLLRMNLTRTSFGIIFSSSGISKGRAGDMAATSLITRAFHQNGSLCVAVSRDDLDRLASAKRRSFQQLLFDKIEVLRYGKPRRKEQKGVDDANASA